MQKIEIDDLIRVSRIIMDEYRLSDRTEFYIYFDKFEKIGIETTNRVLKKLEEKYEVILLVSPAYDEDRGDDVYEGMSMEQITNALGSDTSNNKIMEYIEKSILSYAIAVESEFETFYKKLLQSGSVEVDVFDNKIGLLPRKSKIKYDKNSSLCKFKDKQIKINGVLQREVCKQIFSNRKNVVSFYDVLFVTDESKKSRAVSDAASRLNKILDDNFGFKGVIEIDVPSEKLRLGKKYL